MYLLSNNLKIQKYDLDLRILNINCLEYNNDSKKKSLIIKINCMYLQAETLNIKPQVKVRRTMSFIPSTKERPIHFYK